MRRALAFLASALTVALCVSACDSGDAGQAKADPAAASASRSAARVAAESSLSAAYAAGDASADSNLHTAVDAYNDCIANVPAGDAIPDFQLNEGPDSDTLNCGSSTVTISASQGVTLDLAWSNGTTLAGVTDFTMSSAYGTDRSEFTWYCYHGSNNNPDGEYSQVQVRPPIAGPAC